MQNDDNDPFDAYAPGPLTAASTSAPEIPIPSETGAVKYGVGKPYRIIRRATIATDQGSYDNHE